ncbi:MAG: GNAT family N-acetyltransferase [Parvibaculaceae bacterium]
MPKTTALEIRPLTPSRWPDLEDLFGPDKGANSGCWCMWPRIRAKDFRAMDKAARKKAFRATVEQGPPPGLLAYADGKAIAWVAVSPRSSVIRFDTARNSRLPEGAESGNVWGLTCFYVRTGHRKRGLMAEMARAAVDYARKKKAAAIDVCPIDSDKPAIWGEAFVGVVSVFRDLGFAEIARVSPRRPLMRLEL